MGPMRQLVDGDLGKGFSSQRGILQTPGGSFLGCGLITQNFPYAWDLPLSTVVPLVSECDSSFTSVKLPLFFREQTTGHARGGDPAHCGLIAKTPSPRSDGRVVLQERAGRRMEGKRQGCSLRPAHNTWESWIMTFEVLMFSNH